MKQKVVALLTAAVLAAGGGIMLLGVKVIPLITTLITV